jgi:RNA polymerase sigma-70 factor (ECF subfamily)
VDPNSGIDGDLGGSFEEHRAHLRQVAYRVLGSLSEADDAVQEAWLRLQRADTAEVENLRAWLTTVVARVALNQLRSRRTRREEPFPEQLPDPVVSREDGGDPEYAAELADSVGLALLVVLETLAPDERLAFVLHDMFALPFDEIAPLVDRTPAAARQLASRARRRVRGVGPGVEPGRGDRAARREVVDAFLAAAREGDIEGRSRCWTRRWCCAPTSVPASGGCRGRMRSRRRRRPTAASTRNASRCWSTARRRYSA